MLRLEYLILLSADRLKKGRHLTITALAIGK